MSRKIAKDHDQKRAQILKSAAKVFANEGFDRASMSQLARECGVSKANIYHYYDSKGAILFAILETYLRDLRDRVVAADNQALNAEARLYTAVSEILHAYQGADHEHQVQISSISALPKDQQTLLRGYQRDMVSFLNAIVEQLAPDIFKADPSKLRSMTMSIFGMLNWYYMWNSGAGTQAREDYAKLVSDLTLKGLAGI